MPRPQNNPDWSPDVVIYTDAAVGSDDSTAIGYRLETTEGEVVVENAYTLGEDKPSHIAEYIAVLKAVSVAQEYGYEDPIIYTDFEGVVDHVFGESSPEHPLCHNIKDKLVTLLQADFNRWMLEWLPRDMNEEAHSLANDAVSNDGATSKPVITA